MNNESKTKTTLKTKVKVFFRNTLGIEVNRLSQRKEGPIPLLEATAYRLIYFYNLLSHVKNFEGNIVECGVGYGRSFFFLCTLVRLFQKERKLYGFDSFKGFPNPTENDYVNAPGITEGHYATSKEGVIRYLVKSGIDVEFLNKQVKLVSGFLSETLPTYDGGDIVLLHLDVDLYSSYKDALHYLYPKVLKGGIVAFDEYQAEQKFPGARKAIDEFFNKPEIIIKSNIVNRYYHIKP